MQVRWVSGGRVVVLMVMIVRCERAYAGGGGRAGGDVGCGV